ncbi:MULTISPECIES: hypothetical protein [Pseudomonas]|nr:MULTISPECIES: hypothetical protein [Pseudomonas]ARD10453.1 hypothetical protein PSA3335_04850 [Pseudomonas savastanoi pv. savastanoi NCPPB 3335]AVB17645.1 hypothetical protein BKM19_030185 [Pseudomonas amygdali pv. morsprunorum]KAA3528112.1 hypothetical protein DXU85_30110 [Pseudomonas savastanoi]KPY26749.1 hypothetical protein ALO54_200224 [Pseudomonas syringae pv. philadelphi]KPY67455.1 hypothetical protein ALO58_200192 [Pseudomonas savastanoi pv. savastanoi]
MGKPTSGIAWRPIKIGDTTYELNHLHPHFWDIVIPGKDGKPDLSLKLNISYGLHCFARDRLPGESIEDGHWYQDNREKRVFCPLRWELSKRLPDIIRTLGDRRCMHTGREEFVTVQVVHGGRSYDYAIFFTVTKAKKAEGAQLNLFVNSAHERVDPLRYTKPIKFKFILLNRYQGKQIKPPG